MDQLSGLWGRGGGSTAGRHLYRRPPLERLAQFFARLRKRSGNWNRFSKRQKSCPSTLENPDAHLPRRSLSTIRISQKSEVSVAPKRIISATCRVAEGLEGL